MAALFSEIIKAANDIGPIAVIIVLGFALWVILRRYGVIGSIQVSDSDIDKSIDLTNKRIDAVEDTVDLLSDKVGQFDAKDLHGRLSKVEGYLEGKSE